MIDKTLMLLRLYQVCCLLLADSIYLPAGHLVSMFVFPFEGPFSLILVHFWLRTFFKISLLSFLSLRSSLRCLLIILLPKLARNGKSFPQPASPLFSLIQPCFMKRPKYIEVNIGSLITITTTTTSNVRFPGDEVPFVLAFFASCFRVCAHSRNAYMRTLLNVTPRAPQKFASSLVRSIV